MEFDHNTQIEFERLQLWITSPAANGHAVQVIMVVGCHRGGGTTTTATGLAATLAERPAARVALVDANLRTPFLDTLFGARPSPGFTELLAGGAGETVYQPTERPNLTVITCGRRARLASEMFAAAAVERAVTQLRHRFDHVVIDAAALGEFPDAHALVPHMDAVLLVVEADRTRIDDGRRVVRQLERAGARRAGVVLNRQRDYVPRVLRRFLASAD
jgi:capsular exopolysaccharide synthesis family protein